MHATDPALTVALALAAGIAAQSAARHLRIPGIVLLLAAGVLLGPDVLGVVRPESLGDGLHMLVGMAVAVVLFEGGLNLRLERLREEAAVIRRLISWGVLVTAAGGALLARWAMGWSWEIAILFGTLVTVTGPTVITPLLRRIRVKERVHTIAEAEGVLIDPIGAIVAVVALKVVLETTLGGAALDLLGVPYRLAIGGATGIAGGFLIAVLLRREDWVPEGLENVFTLALVLALYEVSDAIAPESGLLAVVVAGVVVGNMETRIHRELMEFKEQLTVLLIGLLFVLLAADVRMARVAALGWPGVFTVLGLMLVVRPLDVGLSTLGSELDLREKAFLSWLAPRGIVAAAISALFARRLAEAGVEGGDGLVALVFLVIAATVLVQGGTVGLVAGRLGLRRPQNRGWVLAGAGPVGLAMADALEAGGEPVALVDTNAAHARRAERAGHRVVVGNAHDEGVLQELDMNGRRGFVAVTPNEGVNLLLVQGVQTRFATPRVLVALRRGTAGLRERQVEEVGAEVLFGSPAELDAWSGRLREGSAVRERWRYGGDEPPVRPPWEAPGSGDSPPPNLLPLAVHRGGAAAPVGSATELRPGDEVSFAWPTDEDDRMRRRLRESGWTPASTSAASR
jgi:NhaP-type Na+/H+ or K+/H+ antiporter